MTKKQIHKTLDNLLEHIKEAGLKHEGCLIVKLQFASYPNKNPNNEHYYSHTYSAHMDDEPDGTLSVEFENTIEQINF